MGDNIYTLYWQSVLPSIIEKFKNGNQLVKVPVPELATYGNRPKRYNSNFRIVNLKLHTPKSAHAQGRDLYTVLKSDEYIRDLFLNSTVRVNISKDLQLEIEILETNTPDFFSKEDFIELTRFTKQEMQSSNSEHKKTYEILKVAYSKVEYWGNAVLQQIFPNGKMQIHKRPTNQANRFEEYLWAKIFPDQQTYEYQKLGFAIDINSNNCFNIRIDTFGLIEKDPYRQLYLKQRGDYFHSPIVKNIPIDQVLDKGWKYLIDLTVNILLGLKLPFDNLLQLFLGNRLLQTQQPIQNQQTSKKIEMNLNTIFYGPPGTGKTFKLQSLFNDFTITKNVQTREEFLEELIGNLSWWEVVTATMMLLKKTSVPELEKHEFIKIKTRQSSNKHIKQVIWSSLQIHTDPSCEYVKYSKRVEPYLFKKDENSVWEILEDRVKSETPNVIDFLRTVQNFKPATRSVKRNYKMVSFHQSFSYEDFVEGIKPLMTDEIADDLSYEISEGIFYQACNEAARLAGYDNLSACIEDNPEDRKSKIDSAPKFALFIDEINRANVSSVLGELITLIEDDKRLGNQNEITETLLPYSKSKFGVPGNLFIVGTMNTADRSVEALDTALRRRFAFEEMQPQSHLLNPQHLVWELWWEHPVPGWDDEPYATEEKMLYDLLGVEQNFGHDDILWNQMKQGKDEKQIALLNKMPLSDQGINLERMLNAINHRLKVLLTKDHTIGHAWLMNVRSLNKLQDAFKNKILPLLAEFFYNDYAKIGLVLGDRFVRQEKVSRKIFASFNDENELASDYEDKIIYTLADPSTLNLKDFVSIYNL